MSQIPNSNAKVGIGGAPTRATLIPDDAKARKAFPIASGFLDYFPDAVAAVAHLSHIGNEQHNPGQPLHWARSKSGDEADTMMRHFLQRGTIDTDGVRHSAKMAWRALALLQKEIEEDSKSLSIGFLSEEQLQKACEAQGQAINSQPSMSSLQGIISKPEDDCPF